MCARFHVADDKDIAEIEKILTEINEKYKGTSLSAKTGEVFPTNHVSVLSLNEGKPTLSLMEWGMPKWDGKGVVINARSESAAGKPMFSKALTERRCVIPTTGFYEWKRHVDGKTKDKFLFNMTDSPMLYMAGVYSEAKDDKPIRERFVILTQSANDSIKDVHDRMPVILHKNELVRWLSDSDYTTKPFARNNISLTRELA